jgi:hypothetical protein
MTEPEFVPPGVDPTTPSIARIYDYFLGGSHNFAVDRQVAERITQGVPDAVDGILANRGFHGRAARWIAHQGTRQFIDIGSGLPTQNNTHQTVQRVAPEARVVYVDIDPMVAAYAPELVGKAGTVALVTGDLREPDKVLANPDLLELIDFAEPTALLMTAVLHFVPDSSDPWGLVARYVGVLAPGSYLALSHGTSDNMPPKQVQAGMAAYQRAEMIHPRAKAEVQRFFEGLELVPPYEGAEAGLAHVGVWGAEDPVAADSDGSRWGYAGVARKPEEAL